MCLQSLSGLGKLSWQRNGLAAQQTIQKQKRGEIAIRNDGEERLASRTEKLHKFRNPAIASVSIQKVFS
jgi:hypothetical protein